MFQIVPCFQPKFTKDVNAARKCVVVVVCVVGGGWCSGGGTGAPRERGEVLPVRVSGRGHLHRYLTGLNNYEWAV